MVRWYRGRGEAEGGGRRKLAPSSVHRPTVHSAKRAKRGIDKCRFAAKISTMPTASEASAFERGIRPVVELVLPEKAEALLKLQTDPELRRRIDELAGKCTEGQLTEEERAEYEGYVRANKFVAILRRQAEQWVGPRDKGER
jgi:hypothetical protein